MNYAQWLDLVKEHEEGVAQDILFDISQLYKKFIFNYKSSEHENEAYRLLEENTCFENIEKNQKNYSFACTNPLIKIKDKWRASSSTIERISRNKIKKTYKKKALGMLDREIRALKMLDNKGHFPKFLYKGDDFMVMSYVGRENKLKKEMLKQGLDILAVLEKSNIRHRDIRLQNLLVLNDRLYLIDFGWCLFDNEEDTPIESAPRFKDPRNTDKRAMLEIFKNLIQ